MDFIFILIVVMVALVLYAILISFVLSMGVIVLVVTEMIVKRGYNLYKVTKDKWRCKHEINKR